MTPKKNLIPVFEQQTPIEFTNKQLHIFWLPEEIKVEKDVQDVLVNFTPAERHGVLTVLKLFSMFELAAGDEYWGGRFKNIFDAPEFRRMASVFSMFELAVHGPFYNKINELLHVNTPEFYLSYLDSDVLTARMKHIGDIVDAEDDLVSLGMFSMIEGAVLYSNFAFLKHFQARGKNKLLNLVRGIDFSLRDEILHSQAGAWCFKYLIEQRKQELSAEEFANYKAQIEEQIIRGANLINEHEQDIIKMIFAEGRIDGITELQLQRFVQSRINECLKQLGMKPLFEVKDNPIGEWFYKSINDYSFNDVFSGIGNQYHRNWDSTAFTWKVEEQE